MNKPHWSTVYLDAEVPREGLADMMRAAYRPVASALRQRARHEQRGA